MKILAIETSCDDTAVAILEIKGNRRPDFKVLSNIVSSQEIHKKYGGVFPMMAKREHQKNLGPVLIKSLKQSGLLKIKRQDISEKQGKNMKEILEKESELFEYLKKFLEKHEKPEIDLIAVTNGPGLEPCLWVGINFARALSYFWNIPIVPVNHIEAHILVNFLPKVDEISNFKFLISKHNLKSLFPAMSLIVSGGHTQLILVRGVGKYKIIGETRDDAAGECFDKAAKILGLGYPGGPIISEITSKANNPPRPIELPRPMINTKDYDFSFSGLKTAILYATKGISREKLKSEEFIEEICVEIQQAIIDVLLKKTVKAAKDYKAKTVILGGGVSANPELRRQLKHVIEKDIPNTRYLVPDSALSTDNALMIAITGYFHKNKKTKNWKKVKANANLRISK